MLPASSPSRQRRDRFGYTDKRSLEIERMIGRALRAVVELELLGPRTIQVDCDILQADGGTRTASITGSCIALQELFQNMLSEDLIDQNPIKTPMAAISVGFLKEQAWLDLDYKRDTNANVDLNVAMTGSGSIAEIQGTGEEYLFPRKKLDSLLELAEGGIQKLIELQEKLQSEESITWIPEHISE